MNASHSLAWLVEQLLNSGLMVTVRIECLADAVLFSGVCAKVRGFDVAGQTAEQRHHCYSNKEKPRHSHKQTVTYSLIAANSARPSLPAALTTEVLLDVTSGNSPFHSKLVDRRTPKSFFHPEFV
jgi:hypothetical protein